MPQEWENMVYHSEKHGNSFSVRLVNDTIETPHLCIIDGQDWKPVAKFVNIETARQFVEVFSEMLGCTDIKEQ